MSSRRKGHSQPRGIHHLPEPWWNTPAELAHDLDCHVDRIWYYLDCGYMTPAALVPRFALPQVPAGPSPHVCVLLHDYRAMRWEPSPAGPIAPLVGEYRAFVVERDEFQLLDLVDCDTVYVGRSDLVVPTKEREELELLARASRPINPTERRTLLHIIAALLAESISEQSQQPYALAETISRDLAARGISLSRQAIANKLLDARSLLSEIEAWAAD